MLFSPESISKLSQRASQREAARAATPLALLAIAATCLLGCPDPAGSMDEFEQRYLDTRPEAVEVACGTAAASVEGSFVFALATQISAKLPVVFAADLTTVDGELSMSVTALDANDRKTKVGETVELGGFPIDPTDGKFEAALPEITVDGAANPLTKDKAIVATITLLGAVCEDAVCGDARGNVTEPIKLALEEGSTFYMERLPDDGTFPELPIVSCDGAKAGPAPAP